MEDNHFTPADNGFMSLSVARYSSAIHRLWDRDEKYSSGLLLKRCICRFAGYPLASIDEIAYKSKNFRVLNMPGIKLSNNEIVISGKVFSIKQNEI